jgi:hypothetical protein
MTPAPRHPFASLDLTTLAAPAANRTTKEPTT